jgi:DNA repair exonuclease SbcCD ATPase subunit
MCLVLTCALDWQQLSGKKMQKAVKLPKIDSAKGVEPVTQSTQSTELLLANKEMAEVQHKLDRKKEEFDERMVCGCFHICAPWWSMLMYCVKLMLGVYVCVWRPQAKCKEKEEILSMKVAKLKAEEMKFQLFLKENDNKRQRAVKRAEEERKIRDQKTKELDQLKVVMQETEAQLVQSKANLDQGLVYQTYLENVIRAAPEDFAEIFDIIKRYQTLSATNEDLQKLVQTNMDDTEDSRLALSKLSKQVQNEALVRSSEIAELQERLEKAKLQTVIEEGNKAQRQDEAKDAIRELGEAQMATFNLYNRCRATHMSDSRPKHETNKVMVALAYIEDRFRDLQQIVKDGHEAGVVGKVKIREAAVDKQMPKTSVGLGKKASEGAKGMTGGQTGINLNASMTASQSGLSGTAGAQPPLH